MAVVRLNPSPASPPVDIARGWQARLDLAFAARGARTVLARRSHRGPLRVQRPFYPPGEQACHVYILHPPGGVVGGDQLSIGASVDGGAHALLTTPAASKIYRSDGEQSQLEQTLSVAASGRLEWLPQETIVFDGARAASRTRVDLAGDAGFLGWEILCLGRRAAEENFDRGEFVQRFEIYRDSAPLWWERNAIAGGAVALRAPWGLAGYSALGTLVAVGRFGRLLPGLRDLLRAHDEHGEFSVTQLRDVLVCRYLGHSAEQARLGFTAVWRRLRPALWSLDATPPRIWAT